MLSRWPPITSGTRPPSGGPFQDRGGVPVVVTAQLDDAPLDPVRLQAVPAAEARTARAPVDLPGHGLHPAAAHRQHPGVLAVGDRDPVVRATLHRREQRPDVRPGREDGPLRQQARQRQRLEQPELPAGEERHRMAAPVPPVRGQRVEHRLAVGLALPGPRPVDSRPPGRRRWPSARRPRRRGPVSRPDPAAPPGTGTARPTPARTRASASPHPHNRTSQASSDASRTACG